LVPRFVLALHSRKVLQGAVRIEIASPKNKS
jgi:hypothetical protein